MSRVEFADVQGLVRFGYGHLTEASYALVRVKNVAAAKAWLHSTRVTDAAKSPTNTAINIAFTAPGLRALGISESVIAGFSQEFRAGMAQESRARQLGDVGNNAPSNWAWGSYGCEPHAVVMFFGKPEQFGFFVQSTKGTPWSDAFEEVTSLGTSNLDEHEPFGFKDGISQPQIDWEQRRQTPCTQLEYTNIVALGEFLLGYRNEYGKITDRPLLEPDSASAELLAANDAPTKKDLGRNGTYLVMRELKQDVRKFWQFLHQQAAGNIEEARQLGAKIVGRMQSGDPLVPTEERPTPGSDATSTQQNRFTYHNDPTGARCPFGAHIRRANPRNSDFPEQRIGLLRKLVIMLGFGPKGFYDDLTSSVRFHRILRRGREYGSELRPEQALAPAPPNEQPRGLNFICLNANISRQFEFLQNAWISNAKFAGLAGETDPLLGNRERMAAYCRPSANFTMQKENGLRYPLSGLPQFVTVRGGAYFFLPSLRALRYFAGTGNA